MPFLVQLVLILEFKVEKAAKEFILSKVQLLKVGKATNHKNMCVSLYGVMACSMVTSMVADSLVIGITKMKAAQNA